jgi:hypothetical protein
MKNKVLSVGFVRSAPWFPVDVLDDHSGGLRKAFAALADGFRDEIIGLCLCSVVSALKILSAPAAFGIV